MALPPLDRAPKLLNHGLKQQSLFSQRHLCFREHLAFFFFHIMFNIIYEFVKFGIKHFIVCVEFPQLFNEVFDSLMLLKAFRYKLFALLVSFLFEGRIEDGLFELRLCFQFDKDALRNLTLGLLILHAFVVLEQLSDLW